MSTELINAFWGLMPTDKRKDIIMPKSLDELLTLKGVIASGEFSPNGKLINFRSKGTPLPDDVAGLTAQFAAAISQLLGVLAVAHSRISGLNWVPAQGWAYSGGDLTIAVGGSRGVFVKTAEADFNQLFEALIGPRQLSAVGER
jgi:roadblock/LC7 domain-containing protein